MFFAGATKILLFTAKRRSIYNLCKEFEKGDLRPNFRRGGEKEVFIVKDAIKRVNSQVRVYIKVESCELYLMLVLGIYF